MSDNILDLIFQLKKDQQKFNLNVNMAGILEYQGVVCQYISDQLIN